MKTTLQNVRFIIFAIAAVLAIQPVFPQTTNSIVITENSSTSLTATYNNGSIPPTPNGPDSWFLQFPITVVFQSPSLAWIEPENPSLANAVSFPPGGNAINVHSDVSSNFTPVMDEGTVNVGTDIINGLPISLTFDDDAATAEATVPETGSTLGLLSLSLTGLFGASRFRALRLA